MSSGLPYSVLMHDGFVVQESIFVNNIFPQEERTVGDEKSEEKVEVNPDAMLSAK